MDVISRIEPGADFQRPAEPGLRSLASRRCFMSDLGYVNFLRRMSAEGVSSATLTLNLFNEHLARKVGD